jgi:hypothetical protein
MAMTGDKEDPETTHKLLQIVKALTMNGMFQGINRKIQIKPTKFNEKGEASEVLMVVKWGGTLTPLGFQQVNLTLINYRFRQPFHLAKFAGEPFTGRDARP